MMMMMIFANLVGKLLMFNDQKRDLKLGQICESITRGVWS